MNSVNNLNSLEYLTTRAMDEAMKLALGNWWWSPQLSLIKRQARGLLRRAVRFNLLKDWTSY